MNLLTFHYCFFIFCICLLCIHYVFFCVYVRLFVRGEGGGGGGGEVDTMYFSFNCMFLNLSFSNFF